MIKRFACVALTRSIPGTVLEAGDIGAVLDIYDDGAAYEVEFVTADRGTAGLLTLDAADVTPVDEDGWEYRPVSNTSIPHVSLTAA